jgi:hypothetical protein
MEDKLIIKSVTEALTGKQLYEFTVKVKFVEPVPEPTPLSFLDRIRGKQQPAPVQPETERHFTIYPCVAVNQYRIAGMAVTLPTDLFEDQTLMLSYVPEHLQSMIYIIAAAIQNNYKEPAPELITFLERNLDNIDIASLLMASLQATNMQSFMTSIVLMNGMAKILMPETSPLDGSGLIASHTVQ